MNNKNKDAKVGLGKCISVLDNQNFSLVESYKSLRTNILFSLPSNESGCRKVLFSSSKPGEGKTTTCVNTAITLAQTNLRVLLIDADLRKPTIHRYFGFESRVGLTNALLGMSKFDDCIQSVPEIPTLHVITSGVLPPNPSELLSSRSMTYMLEKLSESFDFIIIDSPPINVVTDALAISKLADGVVVVVSHNISRYPDINQTVASLKFAGANILGIVLNRVPKTKSKYGKNSDYSYKYKYKTLPDNIEFDYTGTKTK